MRISFLKLSENPSMLLHEGFLRGQDSGGIDVSEVRNI